MYNRDELTACDVIISGWMDIGVERQAKCCFNVGACLGQPKATGDLPSRYRGRDTDRLASMLDRGCVW